MDSVFDDSNKRPKILIVEDDEVNQRIMQAMLKRLGYHADLAVNGLEALHALENKRYDIVLMDIKMPVMNGIEATKTIRSSLPPAEQPYIIAVTAYALLYSVETCLLAGMNDYVLKPFNLGELKRAINGCRAKAS